MRKILFSLLFFFAALASAGAQSFFPGGNITYYAGAPSGTCTGGLAVNATNGAVYGCVAGVWTYAGGGSYATITLGNTALPSGGSIATVGNLTLNGTSTWNGAVISATYGGTGEAGTLTGILYGNGTAAHTVASAAQMYTGLGAASSAQIENMFSALTGCTTANYVFVAASGNCVAAGTGTTTNSLTFNNGGTGAGSGTAFNGGTAYTISYNSIGAASSGANSNITSLSGLTTPLSSAQGGTGVNNVATLTLGTSNQNWGTLGTGIVTNTTTTGVLGIATSSTIISLWTGTCSSATYLNGAGACATPSGSGTVTASAQYDIAYYPTTGTVATVQGAAISGFVYASASGAPAAATAAQGYTLLGAASQAQIENMFSGLTGCTTANYVFVGASGSCVAVSGSISGLTTGYLPKAASSTTLANSLVDEGNTTANVLTVADTGGIQVNGTGSSAATIGASGTAGTIYLGNATSGLLGIQAATGALGTNVLTLPNATTTLAGLGVAQTFSAVQTISATNGLVLSAMTGTGCLYESSGVVTSTGSACGSGGATFQVNSTNLISATTVNFLNSAATNGLTLTFNNASAGNIQLGFSGTLTNAGLQNSAITIAGTSVSLGGATTSFPTPGPIGGTTPSTGAFTTISATTSVTDSGLTTAGPVTTNSSGLLSSASYLTVAQGGTGVGSLSGFVYGNGTSVMSAATAAQAATLIQGLTGCNTANYVFTPQASDCVAPSGSFPTGSTGNGVYFSGTNTGASTAAINFTGATAASPVAIGQTSDSVQGLEITDNVQFTGIFPGTTPTFTATCASGTTSSCAISSNTGLPAQGILLDYNTGELIKFTGTTSTTITGLTRGYAGTTAAGTSNTDPIHMVIASWGLTSTSTTNAVYLLDNGVLYMNSQPTNHAYPAGSLVVSTAIQSPNGMEFGGGGMQIAGNGSLTKVQTSGYTDVVVHDSDGISGSLTGTITMATSTTSIAPVTGTVVLTTATPTSGTWTTMTVPSGSCTDTGISCQLTLINTTGGSITTGSGTSAGNFAAAYTFENKASMICNAYGATALWYCTR